MCPRYLITPSVSRNGVSLFLSCLPDSSLFHTISPSVFPLFLAYSFNPISNSLSFSLCLCLCLCILSVCLSLLLSLFSSLCLSIFRTIWKPFFFLATPYMLRDLLYNYKIYCVVCLSNIGFRFVLLSLVFYFLIFRPPYCILVLMTVSLNFSLSNMWVLPKE